MTGQFFFKNRGPADRRRQDRRSRRADRLDKLQAVNGSWGRSVQDALERFNSLAKLDLPVDDPEEGTLAALKDWKGPHCTIQATVPRRENEHRYQAVKPPAKTYKKSVTPRP